MALTEIDGKKGLDQHPLYVHFPLEAYLSTPIYLNNTIWGTLNFSSMTVRDTPFTESDIEFVEESARIITKTMEGG